MPKIRKKQACIRTDIYCRLFPKLHPYTSTGIPIHQRPMRLDPDPHDPDTTATLLEPSFVDLIAAIEQPPELSEQRRRHWVCSLRQLAKWLDRPAR
jgi:hypothetical protein